MSTTDWRSTTNAKQRIKTFKIQEHQCSQVLLCGAGQQKIAHLTPINYAVLKVLFVVEH
jgi:hypothetical protein